MACVFRTLLLGALIISLNAEDDFKDFEYNSDEVMIAQESRQYQTTIKSPVTIIKPNGVTNSHRPQYNIDSLESEGLGEFFLPTTKRTLVKNYRSSSNIRLDGQVQDAVLRALGRKDYVGKFSQILPIIKSMSESQRTALASLVASQVTTASRRNSMYLSQIKSIFGNDANTTHHIHPTLHLDTANSNVNPDTAGKDMRKVKQPQILRRSFNVDIEELDTAIQGAARHRIRRIIPPRTLSNVTGKDQNNTDRHDNINSDIYDCRKALSQKSHVIRLYNYASLNTWSEQYGTRATPHTTTHATTTISGASITMPRDNSSFDLIADSSNHTLAQDLPVAEKLRALNRFVDRKVNIRRGTYPPKPTAPRRTTPEPLLSSISRRRPLPVRKLPPLTSDLTKCELFTNSLCLHSEDYPTDAIVQSIRRNKAAAGALLADYKDPGDGALDGVTADQEAKYTADHYLVSNRRGDTANRDFASAGEAGFMCPSTVKYARPQRARATSGQWKYIVNTGEHTQTLRLEKCLKPKDACTYLTDNFKSNCVQVYNYHRLLTWDQPNGLHMDIFKVPTCCSCHIEGYSVSFPPLGHRTHETSSEHFPGEDLSSENGNNAFESVQSTVQRPSIKSPPFTLNKPLESFPSFSDTQNLISASFSKINDNEDINQLSSNPMDSYGNTYFPDSFNQASSVKSVRRPPSARNPTGNSFNSITLPSYLEPPIPSATSSFDFGNDSTSKFKFNGSPFKRGAVRPSRRPIRKKISGDPNDLSPSGTAPIESYTNSGIESSEVFSDYLEESEVGQASVSNPPKLRVTIGPKLQAVTTEINTVVPKTDSTSSPANTYGSNGKRINYNYHPIIDFFGKVEKNEDDSIDRDDSEASYSAPIESGWKPMKHPTSRSIQDSDLLDKE